MGLFLASVLFLHPAVKLIRSATGYGEGLPVVTADDLSDVYDLSDMVGVVGQLAIDSIDGQQWFVAYVDGTQQVVCGQAAQGAQQAVPSLIPLFDQLVAGRMFSLQAEFGLSVPVRFFSVFRQEIGPSADHIATEVPDNDGDAIGGFIGGVMEIFFLQLHKGAFSQHFVGGQAFDG